MQNGLPVKVQQALDSVRVIGNNAVHPGKLDLKDDQQTATSLFDLINIIAETMITQPIEIDAVYQTLLECLRDAERRIQRADTELRALATEAGAFVNLATLERRIMAKLADWRLMSRRNITDGRTVLRALLMEPLRFTPVVDGRRRGYTFEGRIALNRLLAGVIDLPTKLASPVGMNQGDAKVRVRVMLAA